MRLACSSGQNITSCARSPDPLDFGLGGQRRGARSRPRCAPRRSASGLGPAGGSAPVRVSNRHLRQPTRGQVTTASARPAAARCPPWCGQRPSRPRTESPSRNRAYTRRPRRTSRAEPSGESARSAKRTQPINSSAGARPAPCSDFALATTSPPLTASTSPPLPRPTPGPAPRRSVRIAEPDVQGPEVGLEPSVLDRQ